MDIESLPMSKDISKDTQDRNQVSIFDLVMAHSKLRDEEGAQNENKYLVCFKCSEVVEDKDYEEHLQSCSYKPCEYCLEYFPDIMLEDHMNVC